MKSLLSLLVLIFSISSCVHVYFIEPQPKNGIILKEVPQELHGKWKVENTEFKIDKNGINSIKINYDSLSQITDTIYENLLLSDSIMLVKSKNYYVFNYRENNNPWEIAILEKVKMEIF